MNKQWLIRIILLIVFLIVSVILYKIYIPRINAFGCFDDCFNYMGGYFLLHGKQLYSQIFFNHQMIPAFMSELIQWITNPQSIYELLLRHRQLLFAFAIIMDLFLIIRFGWIGFGFAVMYESSKFYLFGDRFLAENFIVYPLVYLFCIAWQTFYEEKVTLFELVFIAIAVWFCLFMREPYTLLTLSLFVSILLQQHNKKYVYISLLVFITLSLSMFLLVPWKDFFFNVVQVNQLTQFSSEAKTESLFGWGIVQVFFYPITLFFGGQWNVFRYLLVGIDICFLLGVLYFLYVKQWKIIALFILLLGFANLRITAPGTVFYAGFHLLIWYSLFLIFTFLLTEKLLIQKKVLGTVGFCIIAVSFSIYILNPKTFFHQKPDPQYDLITNYGSVMQIGTVIRDLSQPHDTLFLDGADDLIYFQAQRISEYPYSWYTSVMPEISLYKKARDKMLVTNPPDFYYRFCSQKLLPDRSLPSSLTDQYQVLLENGNPSCLYIKKSKIPAISQAQWDKAKQSFYTLPSAQN